MNKPASKKAPKRAKTVATSPAASKPAPAAPATNIASAAAKAVPEAPDMTIAGQQLDYMTEIVRKSAEAGLVRTQSFFDQFNGVANKATVTFDLSTGQTKKAAEELSLCAIDGLKSYTDLNFAFARALTSASSLEEVVAACGEHARKQFEQVSKVNGDLNEALGKFAMETSKPFSLSANLPLLD